jgi:hypothetical protein
MPPGRRKTETQMDERNPGHNSRERDARRNVAR